MIREIRIKNYKSILDHTLDLGRINVFIGENGCGKTNLLEAIAMASAFAVGKLDPEELYSRGVRIAKPSSTFSSFAGARKKSQIDLTFSFGDAAPRSKITCAIGSRDEDDIASGWMDKTNPGEVVEIQKLLSDLDQYVRELGPKLNEARKITDEDIRSLTLSRLMQPIVPASNAIKSSAQKLILARQIGDFVIYALNTLALRGIQASSRKVPLGVNGENLDVLISTFKHRDLEELLTRARLVSWLDSFFVDDDDALKFKGHKLGRSTSKLYFRDKFMRRNSNIFSAENANEGILHVMFYLALFISDQTPRFFGIDNIEMALNPRLCRKLISEIVGLAKAHNKQALITTHNPAALDGLNLLDDEQRLFVVYRNDAGHTETKRIKFKPNPPEAHLPLSELWMRGHLGGVPKRF